ncbi:MAG: diacylglycerol kinase [Deltaproteobacteria bacterium]|jgi:diacylglycerol kinase (ATP)|nr:diacylglycerol kinase [Deltaproteobacteria bacterium]
MPKKDVLHHFRHMSAAFRISVQGLKTAAKSETAFKQELLALFALPAAAYFCGVRPGGIVAIIAGWLLVMACELLNMAIESVCNLVSPELNPLVKIAKDAGSAAVFLAILGNVVCWLYLLLP